MRGQPLERRNAWWALLEAALDQPTPSPALRQALAELLPLVRHRAAAHETLHLLEDGTDVPVPPGEGET